MDRRRIDWESAMTTELQKLAEALRQFIRSVYPNDPRNDVPPFMTGVD